MATSLNQTIEILSREKNIDQQVIIAAIEEAVLKAAEKQFRTGEELRARFNYDTGEVELFALMTVVEAVEDPNREISLEAVEEIGVEGAEVGDQLEFPKPAPSEVLGRIAAQTAKQIIFQKVREAERNNVYDEYIERVGELVHGFVKRFEGGRIITDLGKIEAVLPKTQQSRAESFNQGERVRVVINDVSKDAKGPQVEVSRTSPELLKRLFEMEVPEIYDGTVQIKAAVREPGDRAKIAVVSTERDVDPVGACVGMKGSRVQAIIRELRGERIDIIEWSEDPAVFAANALSPAKVSKVEINSFEEKHLTVTVPEDQLSLAIGKKGQNVRLAAKLVGWHIDIRSAEEAARAAAAQLEAVMSGGEATLTDIRESLALDQITAERLKDRGIERIEDLVNISVDDLVDAIDVSFDQANEVLDRARRLLAQRHARELLHPHEAAETDGAEAAESAAPDAEALTAEAGDEAAELRTEDASAAGAETEVADVEQVADVSGEAATEGTEAEGTEAEGTEEGEVEQATEPEAGVTTYEMTEEATAEASAAEASAEAASAEAASAEAPAPSEAEPEAETETAAAEPSPAGTAPEDDADDAPATVSQVDATADEAETAEEIEAATSVEAAGEDREAESTAAGTEDENAEPKG